MLEYLHSVGLPVSDLWGMSEVIMCTLNPPGDIRLGTVGRFLPGMEGRVAEDGELLVRGPHAFSGYVGDPARTAETMGPDGWVRTGDLGRIDDGYLTILGRKKELLITATGKNLMPAVIEGAVKSASPLIDHVVAIAEGRRYVTALIALDPDELARFARARGLDGGYAAVCAADAVRAEVEAAVEAGNATLSRPETIRAFAIADSPWRAGGDEVTTTSKLRRAEISRKYATTIEGLYA
jgi:long-chain acyl-CoA synthetase